MRTGMLLTAVILLSTTLMSVLAHPASATISHATCTNTTLSTSYLYVVNDTGSEVNKTTQTMCPFGCNAASGLCNPDPYSSDSTSMFYFMFPFISFILLYFSGMLKEEDWPIHLLLTASALLFILLPVGIISSALPTAISWLYWLIVSVFFIVMAYYVLKLFARSAQVLGAAK